MVSLAAALSPISATKANVYGYCAEPGLLLKEYSADQAEGSPGIERKASCPASINPLGWFLSAILLSDWVLLNWEEFKAGYTIYSPNMMDEAAGIRRAVLVIGCIPCGAVGILARCGAVLNHRPSCHVAGKPAKGNCIVCSAIVNPQLFRRTGGRCASWCGEMLHPGRLAANSPKISAFNGVGCSECRNGNECEMTQHVEYGIRINNEVFATAQAFPMFRCSLYVIQHAAEVIGKLTSAHLKGTVPISVVAQVRYNNCTWPGHSGLTGSYRISS
jgi:hypothetical protein